MDELHTEPLKKPRKSRVNADQRFDSQGQLVEYEHGYLRHQSKAARGVLPKKSPRLPVFEPQVVSDCGIEILYVLELGSLPAAITEALLLELWWRPAGQTAPLHPLVVTEETTVPTAADQALLKFLMPFREKSPGTRGNRFLLPQERQPRLVGLLAEAGQLRWSARQSEGTWRLHRLAFSGKCPWYAAWEKNAAGQLRPRIWLSSFLNGDQHLESWLAFSTAGWAIAGDALHMLAVKAAAQTIAAMAGRPSGWMYPREAQEFGELLALDGGADLSQMDASLRCETVSVTPHGRLYVTTARYKHLGQEQLQCELSYDYDGVVCAENCSSARLQGLHQVILRDLEEEERLKGQLLELGFRNVTRIGGDEDPGWKLLPSRLDGAVRALVMMGWEIHAEGKSYRRPAEKSFSVSASGIDWLELDASMDFGNGLRAELPELLKAAKNGAKAVRLDDGTYGILPTEWLEKFTALLEIGESDDDGVRFRQRQASLLHAILQEQLRDLDGKYSALLERLEAHPGEAPASVEPPGWFTAALRPYQRQALAWLSHLERQGLAGILADDMGLGKTVEVLSLLARRHEDRPSAPSLVVMPSSLLFNWQSEAARFAPRLKTGRYYGPERHADVEWFAQYDLVFTTYGTIRQDVTRLAGISFDYLILDESQAIKNAGSATAQAVCALQAKYRVAMTGTPVENHLSELFSQLTFLNPGLFSRRFTASLGKENALLRDPETVCRLRKAVAPFLLRRRKEQVARELPPKTEQILWCELDSVQRLHYDELRDFYRKELSQESGSSTGSGTASMLGALLRLRQAACHAGLIDDSCCGNASAKLEALRLQLAGLLESGHKALVFSQFTTFLKLIATELEKEGWRYSYLDGQTRDRGEVVRQFQEDPGIGVFLISLKAGGVGLNLTAADYVFLMDPWWNPATEAQAIDRTYRIGQQRPVFAYRVIARDTIEEKVLLMQQQKRQIATAALGRTPGAADDTALPPEITAQDLRMLLE